jgi:hypothetical protein
MIATQILKEPTMPDDRYVQSPTPVALEACTDVIRVRTGPHDAPESGHWQGVGGAARATTTWP